MLARKLMAGQLRVTGTYVGTMDFGAVTTATWTDAAIGASGLVVAGIVSEDAATTGRVNSCDIGGVAATSVISLSYDNNDANGRLNIALYAREVTGTTATVSFTHNESTTRCMIAVWRLNNYRSVTAEATGSATSILDTVTEESVTLAAVPNGSFAIGLFGNSGATSASRSWTGLTENFDKATINGSTGTTASGAMGPVSGAPTLSVTHQGDTARDVLVCAAWR